MSGRASLIYKCSWISVCIGLSQMDIGNDHSLYIIHFTNWPFIARYISSRTSYPYKHFKRKIQEKWITWLIEAYYWTLIFFNIRVHAFDVCVSIVNLLWYEKCQCAIKGLKTYKTILWIKSKSNCKVDTNYTTLFIVTLVFS